MRPQALDTPPPSQARALRMRHARASPLAHCHRIVLNSPLQPVRFAERLRAHASS